MLKISSPTYFQTIVTADTPDSTTGGLDAKTEKITQAQMVELFQSSKANISEHIKHVFDEGELVRSMVVRKFRTTTHQSTSVPEEELRYKKKTQKSNSNYYLINSKAYSLASSNCAFDYMVY